MRLGIGRRIILRKNKVSLDLPDIHFLIKGYKKFTESRDIHIYIYSRIGSQGVLSTKNADIDYATCYKENSCLLDNPFVVEVTTRSPTRTEIPLNGQSGLY